MRDETVSRRQFLEGSAVAPGLISGAWTATLSGPIRAETSKESLPFGDLKKRLNQYGPFPPTRRRIVLFSTGSDQEDHGPAMAPGSDTYFAQTFCTGAATRTGIRYLAHAPFTADPAGDCAKYWGPIYLPEPEYFDRTAEYCARVLDFVSPRPEGVLIHVPWHGQHIMEKRTDEFGRRMRVRKARLIPDIVVTVAFSLKEEDYKDSPLSALAREAIANKHFQHAGFLDYCVAEVLGHLDRGKLEALRREVEADMEKALRTYPAVSNLAGYIRYGGKELECLRKAFGLKAGDPYPVDVKWQSSCPVVGRAIVSRTIELATSMVLDFERDLFGDNLWGYD